MLNSVQTEKNTYKKYNLGPKFKRKLEPLKADRKFGRRL